MANLGDELSSSSLGTNTLRCLSPGHKGDLQICNFLDHRGGYSECGLLLNVIRHQVFTSPFLWARLIGSILMAKWPSLVCYAWNVDSIIGTYLVQDTFWRNSEKATEDSFQSAACSWPSHRQRTGTIRLSHH